MALGFYSIDIFSRSQVLNTRRRALLQDELNRVLLHMGKYVQRGIGDRNNPALSYTLPNGFVVRIDCGLTPADYNDDTLVVYELDNTNHTLSVLCRDNTGTNSCPQDPISGRTCIPLEEKLSTHIVSGVIIGLMSDPPAAGFYYQKSDNDCRLDVGLVARWNPSQAAGPDNPQVAVRSTFYAGCSSCN